MKPGAFKFGGGASSGGIAGGASGGGGSSGGGGDEAAQHATDQTALARLAALSDEELAKVYGLLDLNNDGVLKKGELIKACVARSAATTLPRPPAWWCGSALSLQAAAELLARVATTD